MYQKAKLAAAAFLALGGGAATADTIYKAGDPRITSCEDVTNQTTTINNVLIRNIPGMAIRADPQHPEVELAYYGPEIKSFQYTREQPRIDESKLKKSERIALTYTIQMYNDVFPDLIGDDAPSVFNDAVVDITATLKCISANEYSGLMSKIRASKNNGDSVAEQDWFKGIVWSRTMSELSEIGVDGVFFTYYKVKSMQISKSSTR